MRLFLIERESPRNTISVSYCVMTYTVLLVALESENKTSSGFMCAPRARSRYCIISTFEQRSRYTFFVFITTNTFPPHTVGALSLTHSNCHWIGCVLACCVVVVVANSTAFGRSVGSTAWALCFRLTVPLLRIHAVNLHHKVSIWFESCTGVCVPFVSVYILSDWSHLMSRVIRKRRKYMVCLSVFCFVLCTHDTESVQMIFCV